MNYEIINYKKFGRVKMKISIGQKLLLLFCIMGVLFVGFAGYIDISLNAFETMIRGNSDTAELLKKVESIENFVVINLIAGFFIGGGILYFLWQMTRSITRPLQYLLEAANEIAAGNLAVDLKHIEVKNEVGELAADFNKMAQNLRNIIGNVKDGVAQLASASEQMVSSSSQIVGGSQEQNMKSTQVATASQELSSTIVDVAKNASEAADSAREANKVAMQGGDVVEKSVESINGIANVTKGTAEMMLELGKRSNEVGDIIKVIDEIASQTNLLALNAAIEAARAGEQGRGFAVVADEVRKLAEKTTHATKEIGETIKMIQDYTNNAVASMQTEIHVVEEGVSFTRNAGSALKEIVSQVESVTSLIQQIATSAEQQSYASNQISEDIEIVAKISGDTTTSAQQIAMSSQNIAVLAMSLQDTVGKFRLS